MNNKTKAPLLIGMLLTIFAIVPMTTLLAEDVDSGAGQYGFKMLDLPAGATIAAMGGAGMPEKGDALGFFSQPAATEITGTHALTAGDHAWIMGTNMLTVGFVKPLNRYAYGFALRYLDYGQIDTRDDQGQIIGEFHPLDIDLAANIAFRLLPSHHAGITAHFLYEKINTASSFGIACDLGYVWQTPVENVSVSAALRNLGGTTPMEDEAPGLAVNGDLTISKKFQFAEQSLDTVVRVVGTQDDDQLRPALGLSWNYRDVLTVRSGYRFNEDSSGLSAGFGVLWSDMRIDYAWLPVNDEDLGDHHIVQISYIFE